MSLVQVSGIREDMRHMRTDFSTGLLEIRREIREDRAQTNDDPKLLTGKVIEIDNRLTRIEERLGPR